MQGSIITKGGRSPSSGYCKSPQAPTNTVGGTRLLQSHFHFTALFGTKYSASPNFKKIRLRQSCLLARKSQRLTNTVSIPVLRQCKSCAAVVPHNPHYPSSRATLPLLQVSGTKYCTPPQGSKFRMANYLRTSEMPALDSDSNVLLLLQAKYSCLPK